MLLGSTLQTAYSIVNALWVGNGLGAESMAALAVSFPIFFLLMAVAGGVTLASGILVSQSFGAKDIPRLKSVVQNSLVLTGLLSVVCLAVGYFGAEAILRAMGTPADVLPVAVGYLRVYVWTTPFMFGVFYLASILRGVGDSKTPLYFQAMSLAVTAALDPFLMFGWLGLPRLELNGTAWATMAAQALSFIGIAWYIRRRDHVAAPSLRNLRLNWPTTWLTFRLGFPSMLQQAMVSLGLLFVVSLVNRFGAHSSAAFGIAIRIDQLAFMPAMTIGMAVSTMAGQNLGAGRFDRVHSVFRGGVTMSCGITAVATLLALAIPKSLIGMFTSHDDVTAIGAHYLRIVGMGYLLFAVMFVCNGIINGAGQTGVTTIFTFVAFWAVRVPCAAYLSHHLGRVEGVWYGVLISLATGAAMSFGYYMTGKWKRRIFEEPDAPAPGVEPN